MLKYVCVSDLHAGAATSLLMDRRGIQKFKPDPKKTSAVSQTVAEALGAFLARARGGGEARPQLIMLGDCVDLQFSKRKVAYDNALTLLAALQQTGEFAGEVIATAGNHDHSIWSDARLGLEADALMLDASDGSDIMNATPPFNRTERANSRLLTGLMEAAGFDSVDLRYPNIGFAKDGRAVMLHHGHFVETPYRMMSAIKDAMGTPRTHLTSAEVSSENAGWIDFIWSTTGDAGFGGSANALYQNLLTPTGYRRLSGDLSKRIGKIMSDALPMTGNVTLQHVLRQAAQVGLDMTLGKYRDTERYAEVTALTEHGFEGLDWYLEGPVADDIKTFVNQRKAGPIDDLTFVFGHTHKPFAARSACAALEAPVKVYNTGGWTLNGPRLNNSEGAAAILIDEDLNVALLHLFKTPDNGTVPRAHIEMLSNGAGSTTFKQELEGYITADPDVWDAVASAAGDAYETLQELLLLLTSGNVRAAE